MGSLYGKGSFRGSQGHREAHRDYVGRVSGACTLVRVCVWGRSWLWVGRSGSVGSLGGVGSGRLSGWHWWGLVAVGRGLVWGGVKVGQSGQGRQGLAQQGSKSTSHSRRDFSSHTHHSHRTPWSIVHASL